MPKAAKRYEVYLPLKYNDGRKIEARKLKQTEKELYERFKGITAVRQENYLRGLWQEEEQFFVDEVIILYVVDLAATTSQEGEQWFEKSKAKWKRRFQQREIFILQQDINLI
ncbi:hypothetical protein HYR99_28675 [Candidatus Poribacteria bacterium]|nr:hypothetical protein [Candidatus Poribacteria bacterium]